MKALIVFTLLVITAAAAETLGCLAEKEVHGFERESIIKQTDKFTLIYDELSAIFGERKYEYFGKIPYANGEDVLSYTGHDPEIAFDYMQVEPVDLPDEGIKKRVMIFNIESKPVWFSCKEPLKEHISALDLKIVK